MKIDVNAGGKSFVPVCAPLLGGNEERYVLDALRSGWISSQGKYLQLFEEAFSSYCNMRHAVATTSGTTALHLALRALGVGRGDEVIVPAFTMIAPALAVMYCGATPVFADSCPDTWCLDPASVEQHITPRTKVVVAVHIYGHLCDMEAVQAVANRHNILVVEDSAEALGAAHGGRKAGSWGVASCFSFYANKIVTTGEGGMVVTNDDVIANRCRSLKNMAFHADPLRKYEHEEIGFNYRMTNIQAAVGLAQMECVSELIRLRRLNACFYAERLSDCPYLTLQVERPGYFSVFWMNGVLIASDTHMTVEKLASCLQENGIETRRFFYPLHRQPVFRRLGFGIDVECPVADTLFERGILLPSGGGLKEREINFISRTVREIFESEGTIDGPSNRH